MIALERTSTPRDPVLVLVGTVDDKPAWFRARSGRWLFCIEHEYATSGDFSISDEAEARRVIARAVEDWRAG